MLYESAVPWRLCGSNAGHGLCASYPELLIVPRSIGDGQVASCASFRCEGRLPALTWCDARDGGSIWRASQPKVGVQGHTNMSDEALVRAIASEDGGEASARTYPLCEIVDCRPRSSANANRLTGHGHEDRDRYKECRLSFANVGNIHAVRAAFFSLPAPPSAACAFGSVFFVCSGATPYLRRDAWGGYSRSSSLPVHLAPFAFTIAALPLSLASKQPSRPAWAEAPAPMKNVNGADDAAQNAAAAAASTISKAA